MKTIYYSELLDKNFDSKEGCLKAEKEYNEKIQKQEEEKNKIEEEKQALKNKIEALKDEVVDYYKKYLLKYSEYRDEINNYKAKYDKKEYSDFSSLKDLLDIFFN